jgi:hypothetical protein
VASRRRKNRFRSSGHDNVGQFAKVTGFLSVQKAVDLRKMTFMRIPLSPDLDLQFAGSPVMLAVG